ncbi:MAG TPA: FMN-dependent NADH-azoreductase [Tahibacter sp.]|jgi:FMN-dependent NADH-azoreductase|nr:FMN-dependent NADH-azoreductase [Tahibacter sp.]
MSTLLHIDSSARREASVSRRLTQRFADEWRSRHPDGRVIVRDLAQAAPPHVSESLIGAYFTPEEQRDAAQRATLAESDALVDELLAADTIVIGAPMYNFALPSSLKAWIDHVVRVGRTFAYGANGPSGLVHGKRVVVILSRGGVYSDGPAQAMDFQTGYLRSVLGFIGITDVEFVAAEGVAHGEDSARNAIAQAEDKLLAAA